MTVHMNKPVCVIVGADSSNAIAFTRRFWLAGYQIVLLTHKNEFTKDLVKEIDNTWIYVCDVTDVISVEQTFAAIRAEFGKIDTLIFNSGVGVWRTVEDVTLEEFEHSWRVNALGALLVSKQIVPDMKQNNYGNIIFISTIASRHSSLKTAAFGPAKAAQKSLAESMARHLSPFGVHVATIIMDGVVDTLVSRQLMKNKPNDSFIQSTDLAEVVFDLTKQKQSTWSSEIEVRSFREVW